MRSRTSLVVLVVFLMALVPRVVRLVQGWDAPQQADSIEYESLGHSLATGQGYQSQGGHPLVVHAPTAFRTPGLPLFIAAHYRLLGRVPQAPRVTLVLLNALGAALLYLLLRAMLEECERGPAIAAGAAALYALWPESLHSFYQNDLLLAESLTLPLLLLAAWCYARASRRSAIAAGVFLGLAILCRAFLVLLPPILCALALLCRGRRPLRRALLTGVVAALLVLPWTARNFLVFHRFVPLSTQQGISLWYGWNDEARGSWTAFWDQTPPLRSLLLRHPELPALAEPARSALYAEDARAAIARRGLWGNGKLLLKKWALYAWPRDVDGWHPELLLLLPLCALGVAARLRSPRPLGSLELLWLALLMNSVMVVGLIFMDQRFRYVALPALFGFGVLGAAQLLAATAARSASSRRG